MRLFYDPDITTNDQNFILNEEESRHISKVLRMKPGEAVGVLNGKGHLFEGKIIDCGKKCKLEIVRFSIQSESDCRIHIAVAPTKNIDRIEWFVEKATEIGITELSFFYSKNSERNRINLERIEKKAVSAMKQSGRWDLPVINELSTLDEFLARHPIGLIAHCVDDKKETISSGSANGVPILIGPEGDFTADEISKALNSGYKSITLGKNRLRTETAALYACMQVKLNCL